MRLIIPVCIVAIWATITPSLADNYNLQFSTNANQENTLAVIYRQECLQKIAEAQPVLAGCTADCATCTPILSEKQAYLMDKLVLWFTSTRTNLLRQRALEVASKYHNLPQGQRSTIDSAAGLEPLQ